MRIFSSRWYKKFQIDVLKLSRNFSSFSSCVYTVLIILNHGSVIYLAIDCLLKLRKNHQFIIGQKKILFYIEVSLVQISQLWYTWMTFYLFCNMRRHVFDATPEEEVKESLSKKWDITTGLTTTRLRELLLRLILLRWHMCPQKFTYTHLSTNEHIDSTPMP